MACIQLGNEVGGWQYDCCEDLCEEVPDEDDAKELCEKECAAIIESGKMPPPDFGHQW